MAKGHGIWRGFNSGELTPLLDGQIGFEKYATGCKRLENFIPTVQGPAINRPGLRYIADTKNSSTKKARLVPFEFSTTQAYMIEFGHLYCRFYMNKGQLTIIDSYTKLLLSINGIDASTTFTDDELTPKTITANGNVKLTTTNPKFGSACGVFDGVQSYLSAVDHADWDFGAGDATVEGFIKTTATSKSELAGQVNSTGADKSWQITLLANGKVTAIASSDGTASTVNLTSTSAVNDGNFHHIAFVRSGDVWTLYIDGVAEATATSAITVFNSSSLLKIGGGSSLLDSQTFNSSGAFTVPAGVYSVQIEAWGGGGGGGGGVYGSYRGGGGAGGGYGKQSFNVIPGVSYQVTVGGGGAGAVGNTGAGNSGGTTSVGSLISATGGQGGQNNAGSAGGDSSATIHTAGGAGIDADGAGAAVGGSGGNGGAGGAGSIAAVQNGLPGTVPGGGGGGGGNQSGNGGNGAVGKVVITYSNYFIGTIDEFRISKGIARYTANFTPVTSEFLSLSQTPYEVTTTYTETELPELQFAQSNDVLYIAHPNHKQATLSRTGHTAWTLADISFTAAPAAWGAGTYPACVAFFEQRLWFAYLQTVWASKSGDYTNMTTGTAADAALAYTIASQQVNKIQWLASTNLLIAGTAGGEYKISASSLGEAITPSNIRIVRQAGNGSDYREALSVLDVVLHLQRSKRKIRELTYNSLEDKFVSPDMTVLARHLFDSNILYWTFQQEPYSIVWCVNAEGDLLGFTYHRLEGITAWHKHVTDGTFESCACIYSNTGNNELWVIVNRTIGGVTKRYIEMLEEPFDGSSLNAEACFFVDSGLTYNGVSTSSISGLTHLAGKTVSVLADGVVFDDAVVSAGGTITLKLATVTTPATIVVAGLPYTSILQTMRPEAADGQGTAQGRKKRTNRVVFRFYKTKQYQMGRTPTGTLNRVTLTSMYTGDDARDFQPGWDREGHITIQNDKPLPITVISIIPEMATS